MNQFFKAKTLFLGTRCFLVQIQVEGSTQLSSRIIRTTFPIFGTIFNSVKMHFEPSLEPRLLAILVGYWKTRQWYQKWFEMYFDRNENGTKYEERGSNNSLFRTMTQIGSFKDSLVPKFGTVSIYENYLRSCPR